MPAADKPPPVKLSELSPGGQADFFARLAEKTKSATRDGKPFYACKFTDAGRSAAVMVWADSPWFADCESSWKAGDFYKIRGVYQEHERYGPQIDVHQIRPVAEEDRKDGFDEADFVDRSRFDPGEMFAELRSLLEAELRDVGLRELALKLLDDNAEPLKALPASPRHYFPFRGGWLEHTLSVAKSCLWLCERYVGYYEELKPPLNRDLVLAGAALHEIGRAAELETTEPFDATVDGHFFGHIALGRDMVREAAREIEGLDPELFRLLEHVLQTYLRLPEWGSPRLPLIPEVLILHHADDLDAKLEMYARCLSRDASDGPFTERDPVLGKQLFRGRDV